ncbi:TPA: hypothetical protein ACIPUI_000903 [Citrobacter freundii]
MRMTSRKKEILSYYEPECQEWVTSEIGAPPFDVSGMAYLLHQTSSFDNKHQVESTRRTLEGMVKDGLLEKVMVYERRQNRIQSGGGDGVRCMVARYGLPGTCTFLRDEDGADNAIDGEFVRVA